MHLAQVLFDDLPDTDCDIRVDVVIQAYVDRRVLYLQRSDVLGLVELFPELPARPDHPALAIGIDAVKVRFADPVQLKVIERGLIYEAPFPGWMANNPVVIPVRNLDPNRITCSVDLLKCIFAIQRTVGRGRLYCERQVYPGIEIDPLLIKPETGGNRVPIANQLLIWPAAQSLTLLGPLIFVELIPFVVIDDIIVLHPLDRFLIIQSPKPNPGGVHPGADEEVLKAIY